VEEIIMGRLPSRQVHLDFHTSELILGIGERYSKENFQEALKLGHLNSITVFAKCHHSWCYYPTEVGSIHPHLDFDLTGAMVEAAHEIGVRAPIYITVGWSATDAENHPDWLVRDKKGNVAALLYDLEAKPEDKKPITSWKFLCPNGDYAKHIYELTKEVCGRYETVDGLFYDICFGPLCWCESCVTGMKAAGLDPEKLEDARIYHRMKWQNFMSECTRIMKEKHPDATVFFNGGANQYEPQWHAYQTHFEMEDLPTTWGGYDKMPLRAKYFSHTGKDYLGMTGKFHTMWGEFGGYKNPEALKFECAAMLAFGARCSVGDQMHPDGEMDLETYKLIGHAYDYVEKIEDWCYDVEETSKLGVMFSGDTKSDEGMVKVLMEAHLDFDLVKDSWDFENFDSVILPDSVLLCEEAVSKLNSYIEKGGSVVLTGKSGLNKEKNKFMVDCGVSYEGASEYDVDYLVLGDKLNEGLVKSPFLFYEGAERVKLTDGEILACKKEPYFSRTYGHYCSHQNTPYKVECSENPGAVKKGNVVYIAHSVFKQYYDHGAQIHRDYVINALRLVYKSPNLRVENLPSAGRVRFVKQPGNNRYVLHLLYASPIQRGRAQVIEDMPPIYDVKALIEVKDTVKKAYLAPQGDEIGFVQEGNKVTVTVPKIQCHQMVVFEY
jgi:hypothetical protein